MLPSARDSNDINRIPHLKSPKFKDRDGENILFWLHQLEIFFVLYQIQDDHKTLNASQCIRREVDEFYLYLLMMNDDKDLSWKKFRHAYLSCYHNSMIKEEILRYKLDMIIFKDTQCMSEYCEQFRHYEV